uniref:Oligodendrocyte myelin glycoprotein b n=1 Tax=Oryzias latipes TaxID=8090 RepID=A0A3P9KE91_ORYLA
MPVSPAALLVLLLCDFLGCGVLSVCPSVCSCSSGHRVVDCSSRGLTKLPPGLQHNIHFLNLSFNSMQSLDSHLSRYGHLRTLDLSFNRLVRLPSALPRSLWDVRAVGNHLHSLDKNDTAYHWNLRELDLSDNELERVVFINNTLLNLRGLNLSHNRFWTVPTNMPHNLEVIDLSHNYMVKILPGSLDRLPRLLRLYMHANRFSWLPKGIFDKLNRLEIITLGDNPWACEEEENITGLLRWSEETRTTIFGCPCYTTAICGRTHQVPTGREHSSALLTEPPLWVGRADGGYGQSPARTAAVTSKYQARPALHDTAIYRDKGGEATEPVDWELLLWTSSPGSHSPTPHTSTTARLRASRQPKMDGSQSDALNVRLSFVVMTFSQSTGFNSSSALQSAKSSPYFFYA